LRGPGIARSVGFVDGIVPGGVDQSLDQLLAVLSRVSKRSGSVQRRPVARQLKMPQQLERRCVFVDRCVYGCV